MKPAFYLLGVVSVLALTSCVRTTLENRRDLYGPEPVNGPYTRMLHHGIPKKTLTTVITTSSSEATGASDGKTVVK